MLMTNGKPVILKNLPDTEGKKILLQILNSPRVDREILHQESLAYQREEFSRYSSLSKKADKK